jgi:subtilase family serine protease
MGGLRWGALAGGAALAVAVAGALAPAGVTSVTAGAHQQARAVVRIQPGVLQMKGRFASPPTTGQCESDFGVACYEPTQIQQAYGLPTLFGRGTDGNGQTIVIVDPFGAPDIRSDLAAFDSAFSIPAPPSFTIAQPAGHVPPYTGTGDEIGWAGETTLDVEYSHTIAPGASIVLLETPTAETEGTTGFPQIVKAEKYAINHHLGGVISQSFGATEETFPAKKSLEALRGAYLDGFLHGVTMLAATGDDGAAGVESDGQTFAATPETNWPATDPLVTAVGGTQLHLNAHGNPTSPASAWNDTYSVATNKFIFGDHGPNPLGTGGGLSSVFPRPLYQIGVRQVVGSDRGTPDIAMSAACNGGVDTYESLPSLFAGWGVVCGTSEATPEFAGIVALADQVAGHPLGLINPELYLMSALKEPGIVDVTSGNNSVSFSQDGGTGTVTGYNAGTGYDLDTGVGTVYAPAFVPDLARFGAFLANRT